MNPILTILAMTVSVAPLQSTDCSARAREVRVPDSELIFCLGETRRKDVVLISEKKLGAPGVASVERDGYSFVLLFIDGDEESDVLSAVHVFRRNVDSLRAVEWLDRVAAAYRVDATQKECDAFHGYSGMLILDCRRFQSILDAQTRVVTTFGTYPSMAQQRMPTKNVVLIRELKRLAR